MKKKKITSYFANITPFQLAFLINALFLICYLISGTMKYEVSDDFMMEVMVSGAYTGTPSPYIMFMNPLIGLFLSTLYKLHASLNWYFYFQVAMIFLSLTGITYLILKKKRTSFTLLLAVLFIGFFSNDLYQLMQFTKTATVTIGCGCFFLITAIVQENISYKRLLLGACYVFIGTMIRNKCFYITVAFLFLTCCLLFLRHLKQNQCSYKVMIKPLFIFACTLGICYAFVYGSSKVFTSMHPDYAAYKEYNEARAIITDYPVDGYQNLKDDLSAIGVSENDFYNLAHFGYGDTQIYDADYVKQVSEIIAAHRLQDTPSILRIGYNMLKQRYDKYISVLGCLAIGLAVFIKKSRSFLLIFANVLVTGVLLIYIFYQGRVVYRVEYSIFLSLAISILCYDHFLTQEHTYPLERFLPAGIVILLLMHIPSFLPNTHQNFAVMFNSWENHVGKYRASFIDNRQEGILQEMQQHPNRIYYLGFQTTIQTMYLNYDPRFVMEPNMFNNAIYLAGVDSFHPSRMQWLQEHKLKGTMEELLDKDVYLIENIYQEEMLNFIKEHYDATARLTQYAVIDGYQIWKIEAN